MAQSREQRRGFVGLGCVFSLLLLIGACAPAEPVRVAGGIGGTGVDGIGGTGNSGIGGTGIDGIGGTGKSGIGGTGIDGIGGTGIAALGVVQGFGSIFVNGREYFLEENTRISIDGRPATEQDLQIGDVVLVKGIVGRSGQAQGLSVEGRHAVQGKVDKVSAARNSITVLGQEIRVAPDSLVRSEQGAALKLRDLKRGDHVTVSALARPGGGWGATEITRGAAARADAPFLLRATVGAVSADKTRVRVGGQRVQIRQAPLVLRPGQRVMVSGHYDNGVLRAETIQSDVIQLGKPGDRVEMIGFVRSGARGQLSSHGVRLHVDRGTEMRGGDRASLKGERLVGMHGTVQKDGSVALERVAVDVRALRYELSDRPVKTRPEPLQDQPVKQEQRSEKNAPGKQALTDPARTARQHDAEKSRVRDAHVDRDEKPDAKKSDVEKARPDKPDTAKPDIEKPQIDKPEVEKPQVERPEKPDTERPDDARPDRPDKHDRRESHVDKPERRG